MAALAAGVGAALAGPPEQAEAQASGLTVPHPEGARVYVVDDLSLETQQQIMDALLGCLQEGAEISDFDGNGRVDPGDEAAFFVDDQASCGESAERQINIAKNEAATTRSQEGRDAAQARIELARTRATDARDRIDTANARIEELTQQIIDGSQVEPDS